VEAGTPGKLAVGVDVRNRAEQRDRLPQVLGELARLGVAYRLVFLDARDDVLIKRYAETRRRHPLSEQGLSLAEALAEERRLLRPLVALADRVVDTSDLNVHQLRRLVITEMDLTPGTMTLLFESFAYRRGVPPEADFLFDARNLPNPHWDARLRPLSGKDAPVRDWLADNPRSSRTATTCTHSSNAGCRDSIPTAELRDDLHRLHRRPPSFGLPRRIARRALPRRRRAGVDLSSGTGMTEPLT
jgi:UPF0042 nucleotide-binding protein